MCFLTNPRPKNANLSCGATGHWVLLVLFCEIPGVLSKTKPLMREGRITSRKYYNFMNDAKRQGDTIKPFTEKQSWGLLMQLLGPDWQDMDKKGLIKGTEEAAAKNLLKDLGGVCSKDLTVIYVFELMHTSS